MKKILIAILLLCFLFLTWFILTSVNSPDYAGEYGEVFGSYDIAKVDEFLNGNPVIKYKNLTGTYEQLRPNIIYAFEKKRFQNLHSPKGGIGKDGQGRYIYCQVFGTFDKKNIWEYVKLRIKIVGPFSTGVAAIECDDSFFGYMFFGEEAFEETIEDET